MKTRMYLFALALLVLLLTGCTEPSKSEPDFLVSIRESSAFSVRNNGQHIQPGGDAVFILDMKDGFCVVGADYDGDYRVVVENEQIKLTIFNVEFTSRISLQVTDSYRVISYAPNGGTGETLSIPYDTSLRSRPNTQSGAPLFTRDGYTLESWNTKPDGSGLRIGLGSRATVPEEGLTLYAQWAKWSAEQDFRWSALEDGAAITAYHGSDAVVTVPAVVDGHPVTAIAPGAFQNCDMTRVILPATMVTVADGAFQNCCLTTLTLFDNIESISDAAFTDCNHLRTLQINAMEKPYGTDYRRESCYADKVDLLIQAQGEKKIVFYGGCSTWYNLDSAQLTPLLNRGYRVINMGLNGLSNSVLQMQILGQFLEDGDILLHTPELSSETQMMLREAMQIKDDDKLWCGLEYNYDLMALADLRMLPCALDTFCGYLSQKKTETDYNSVYDKDGKNYCDEFGCVAFFRDETESTLADRVYLDASFIDSNAMERLQFFYDQYQAKGVRVYLSYACVNMDDVPEDQKNNLDMMQWRFREAIEQMNGPIIISRLEDYLFRHDDFYDTNYHLLSRTATENTLRWLRDLQAQMERDGLWEAQ